MQTVIIVWTFLDPHDIEHDVLLSLDFFAVILLVLRTFCLPETRGGSRASLKQVSEIHSHAQNLIQKGATCIE